MNVPNFISVFRIMLAPLFVYIMLGDIPNKFVWGFVVFMIAGISDMLDGIIARKFNLITPLGSVLDPLADKLMLFSVLFSFYRLELVEKWVLYILGIKECFMIFAGGIMYLSKYNLYIPANRFGKFATVLFYAAVVSIILVHDKVGSYPFVAVAIVSAVAAVSYMGKLITQVKLIKRVDKH